METHKVFESITCIQGLRTWCFNFVVLNESWLVGVCRPVAQQNLINMQTYEDNNSPEWISQHAMDGKLWYQDHRCSLFFGYLVLKWWFVLFATEWLTFSLNLFIILSKLPFLFVFTNFSSLCSLRSIWGGLIAVFHST